MERDPRKFWKKIGRMMGRKKRGWVETFKNELGEELRTERERERWKEHSEED